MSTVSGTTGFDVTVFDRDGFDVDGFGVAGPEGAAEAAGVREALARERADVVRGPSFEQDPLSKPAPVRPGDPQDKGVG
ncbi:hypothetical protein [Rhodoplanes azumiensis]|uniref:Uncharacterized protein n=1 Tax=Rhodoplanes azumiensis TaxID=1897628 RepID=A0ABW5AKG5_9BRAD